MSVLLATVPAERSLPHSPHLCNQEYLQLLESLVEQRYLMVPFPKSWPTESVGVINGGHFVPLNLEMACYTAKRNQNISLLGTDCVTLGKTVILFKEPFLQNSYLKIKSCFPWCCQDKMRQRMWTSWHGAQYGCKFPCEVRKGLWLSQQVLCIFPLVRHPPSHPPRT